MSTPAPGASALPPSVFNFQSLHQIRILRDDAGAEWFVLADVCKAVDYANPAHAQNLIDVDDLQKLEVIDALGRPQVAWCCTEMGLYQFLASSQVEKAKPFRRWVFGEVLPALRRAGHYGNPSAMDARQRLSASRQIVQVGTKLVDTKDAMLREVLLADLRALCEMAGLPMPNITLLGKDARQIPLDFTSREGA